jgi:hypothetical protein
LHSGTDVRQLLQRVAIDRETDEVADLVAAPVDPEMLGHSGATFGFASRLVIDTTRKRAAIA